MLSKMANVHLRQYPSAFHLFSGLSSKCPKWVQVPPPAPVFASIFPSVFHQEDLHSPMLIGHIFPRCFSGPPESSVQPPYLKRPHGFIELTTTSSSTGQNRVNAVNWKQFSGVTEFLEKVRGRRAYECRVSSFVGRGFRR